MLKKIHGNMLNYRSKKKQKGKHTKKEQEQKGSIVI